MFNKKLVESVLYHSNRKYLIQSILNGTNHWLYQSITQLHPGLDAETTGKKLSSVLHTYLNMYHRVYRKAGITSQSYSKFYQENNDTTEAIMVYLLKTLRTLCGNLYIAVIIAIWIDLERKEDVFGEYVKQAAGEQKNNRAVFPTLLFDFVWNALNDNHPLNVNNAA
ncbi:MAG: hypothetical protein ABFD12_07425 [Syntrophorhabdus sp.]|mgnify:FL=1|jgi:hypothetical protein|nr:hypothetical protein [Candidatus Omnitrophota bacterium]MDX9820305.1 hypothetical protein [Syntrophales bacterium]